MPCTWPRCPRNSMDHPASSRRLLLEVQIPHRCRTALPLPTATDAITTTTKKTIRSTRPDDVDTWWRHLASPVIRNARDSVDLNIGEWKIRTDIMCAVNCIGLATESQHVLVRGALLLTHWVVPPLHAVTIYLVGWRIPASKRQCEEEELLSGSVTAHRAQG